MKQWQDLPQFRSFWEAWLKNCSHLFSHIWRMPLMCPPYARIQQSLVWHTAICGAPRWSLFRYKSQISHDFWLLYKAAGQTALKLHPTIQCISSTTGFFLVVGLWKQSQRNNTQQLLVIWSGNDYVAVPRTEIFMDMAICWQTRGRKISVTCSRVPVALTPQGALVVLLYKQKEGGTATGCCTHRDIQKTQYLLYLEYLTL